MKALVLAAGFGSRLKPWTDELPKPLIPVAGVEPLFFALWRLHSLGVREAFVNAHHMADKLAEALNTYTSFFPGMKIVLSHEKDQILGTGGAILKIISEHKMDSSLLVMNADTLAGIDFSRLVGAQSTFAMSFRQEHLERYGPLKIDHDKGAWVDFDDKQTPYKSAHFLGVHYLSRSAIDILRLMSLPVEMCNLFDGIYKPLLQKGHSPVGVPYLEDNSGFWFDLNKKEYFQEAREALLTDYSKEWDRVLKHRHPEKSSETALSFWPLSSI
jgi:MurNAc alpha-1-phosphate uridylyltransferase